MTSVSDRREERIGGRIPPHSIESEESVLGAILLSSDAANEVMDKLDPEDFYHPAHQSIYGAIRTLYNANQAIDAITVSEELRRVSALERVGGVSYLTRLLDVVPSASNVEYYAGIVEEHAKRRNLIRAGSSITDLAFRLDDQIVEVLDRAEQTVLGVAGRKSEGIQPIGPLFFSTLEELEALEARGSEVTGLTTGFRDLDRKLTGLHPANLMIVAARPAMGKCLLGSTRVLDSKTGALVPIRELVEDPDRRALAHVTAYDTASGRFETVAPTDGFDNGVRPVFRLRTRLGRELTATANHPLLTVDGWRRLDELAPGDEVAVPGRLDVFGVDCLPDAEVALLGLLIGDGTLTGTTPRITLADPVLVDDARRWAAALGADLRRSEDSITYRFVTRHVPQRVVADAGGVSSATVSLALAGDPRITDDTRERVRAAAELVGHHPRAGNPIATLLERHGIAGCTAHDKRVPGAVFRLPKEQIALFLSRLFATDGSAWVSGSIYRIEYSTVSEQLARDVQHLLLRFGVVAKLRRRMVSYDGGRRQAWDVSFQDPASVLAFCSEIGIASKEEAVERVRALAEARVGATAAWELLPMRVWDLVLAEKGARSWADVSEAAGRPRNHNWHVHRRRPSRRVLGEIARALGSASLEALASGDVVWDPVVAIEPAGRERTYDITVPGYQDFVADDVVVHNSALSLNIATNVAMERKPVAVFSLEMSKEEVAQRMLCSVARIDSMKLRTGQIGEAAWPRLTDAAGKLYDAPVYVDDSPVVTVTDIRAKCRRLKRKHGLELVVVDYLQLMQGSSKENRQQEIAEISRSLKNLARELDVPIIAVSQLNRNLESREDKRPRLGDLRESGSLEQDADIVLFIYRDEYYNEMSEKRGVAEVMVAKHRAGGTGTVEMTFMPEFTKFSDLGRD
jgi:replicative DNA helicase